MKASKYILITAIISLAFGGQALGAEDKDSSDWVHITQDSDNTDFYSGKRGSYDLTETKGGTTIAIILGQVKDKKANSVTYRKWYVTTTDCEAGIGKLVVLKINGEYYTETDYVSKGNNIASAVGDLICGIYLENKKKIEAKGV